MDAFFTVRAVGAYTLVEFQTSALVNPAELDQIAIDLDKVIDHKSDGKVLLDFTKVEFLSSQSIGLLVALHKKATKIPGGQLVLCGVGAQLLQMLKITRLDGLLKIVKNQKDALKK